MGGDFRVTLIVSHNDQDVGSGDDRQAKSGKNPNKKRCSYFVFHNGLSIVITFSLSLTLSLDDKKVFGDFGALTLKVLSPWFAINAPSAADLPMLHSITGTHELCDLYANG